MITSRSKSVGPGEVIGQYNVITNGVLSGPYNNKGERYQKYSHYGFNTPNFYGRLRNGDLLPFTAWVQKEWTCSAFMSWSGGRLGGTQSTVGNAIGTSDALGDITSPNNVRSFFSPGAFDTQPYVDAAAAKIYSSGWDTGTFLAELGKTFHMFRRVGGNLANLLKEWSTVKKTTKVTLDAWLEGRYGWRILVYDIIDISKALNSLSQASRTRSKDRSGHSFSYTNYVTIPDFHWLHAWHTVVLEDSYDVSLRGSVVADLSPPKFRFNVITTAWEVIPFSFVIDWFFSIGSWLESLSFLMFSSNHTAAGGITIRATRKLSSHSYVFLNDDGYGPWSGSFEMRVEGEGSWTTRSPLSVSNFPHFRVALDGFKVLDLIALVRQLLWR